MNETTTFPKDNYVNLKFKDIETELEQKIPEVINMSLPDKELEGKFLSMVKSSIEVVKSEVLLNAEQLNSELYQKYKSIKETLNRDRECLRKLNEEKEQSIQESGENKKQWFYYILYGVLLTSMFGTASFTVEKLLSEGNRVLAWTTSVVFLGGSFCIREIYRSLSEVNQKHFKFVLAVLGVMLIVGSGISIAKARQTLETSEQNLVDKTSFLANEDEFGLEDYSRIIAVMFILVVFAEQAFSSLLLIYISENQKLKKKIESIEASIANYEASIAKNEIYLEGIWYVDQMDELNNYLDTLGEKVEANVSASFSSSLSDKTQQAKQAALEFINKSAPQTLRRFATSIGGNNDGNKISPGNEALDSNSFVGFNPDNNV